MLKLFIKRVYEQPRSTDGYRVLIDRLWPRGLSKEKADIDEWVKGLAPSTELRKWFNHDVKLWQEFSEKYTEELRSKDFGKTFIDEHKNHKVITLLYAAKDEQHCNAIVLKNYLETFL